MQFRRLALFALLISTAAHGRATETYVIGETRDCFSGNKYRPAGVDVYLLDPQQSPAITSLLHEMQAYLAKTDDQNMHRFFSSYARLTRAVRKAKVLGHVKSDKFGGFSFHDLESGMRVTILGISEREDDPAYFASQEIASLQTGKNDVTLNFDRGSSCP